MQICRTVADLRQAVAALRGQGRSVALVPTMGALHAGHLALMAEARGVYDAVVATIFVNPTQFGSAADLDAYPRTEARDVQMLTDAGVDALFIPPVSEIYPDGDETVVETTRLAHVFHGAVRPGHFRGVATVVTKLFNIAGADGAFFGEKDYQQVAVIRRMVRDLHMPVRIHTVATVREPDGLAMSSRNVRLSPEDRAAAPVLCAALDMAENMSERAATVEEVAATIERLIRSEPRARFRACDIVWDDTFEPASGPLNRPAGVMVSAEFGPPDTPVLLIDQRVI